MSEPLELIAPGEILLEEFMRPHAISQNRLSRDINVPVARINEIVKGKRAITADTALRLGKYFGTSAELWLGLQMEYDIRRARRDVWPAIEPRTRSLTAVY
jgi:addiction module HigA family antidote